jgi:hypothetical protein
VGPADVLAQLEQGIVCGCSASVRHILKEGPGRFPDPGIRYLERRRPRVTRTVTVIVTVMTTIAEIPMLNSSIGHFFSA